MQGMLIMYLAYERDTLCLCTRVVLDGRANALKISTEVLIVSNQAPFFVRTVVNNV